MFLSSEENSSREEWASLVLSGKESACQCRRQAQHGFSPWVGKIPWSRKRQPTRVSLPGKSHGQKSLVGYSPWGHKELDMTEQLSTAHILSKIFSVKFGRHFLKNILLVYPKSLWSVTAAMKSKNKTKQKKTVAPWKKGYDKPRQHIKK